MPSHLQSDRRIPRPAVSFDVIAVGDDTGRDGERFGVASTIERIDLQTIVRNVFSVADAETEEREEALRSANAATV